MPITSKAIPKNSLTEIEKYCHWQGDIVTCKIQDRSKDCSNKFYKDIS